MVPPDRLGEEFDLKEFHNTVLGSGSLPLEILERVVQDYIDAKTWLDSACGVTVPAPATLPLFEWFS